MPARRERQAPVRLQRRRTKGWRLPPGAAIVDRTTPFGNPYTVRQCVEMLGCTEAEARRQCAAGYEAWLCGVENPDWEPERRRRILGLLPTLAGRDLACSCPLPAEGGPDPCHGAVLLRLVNHPAGPAEAVRLRRVELVAKGPLLPDFRGEG